jgi:hypothetical protein|tara:strand:+ start:2276 stop:2653 length:378 start_codon:yes stop_codon:yes gene_type:complete
MSILGDRLIALQQEKDRFSFDVEGLGVDGNPLTVFFTKLTVREDERLRKLHPKFYQAVSSGDIPSFKALVDLICLKAEDESGTKLFDEADKQKLLGMDVGFVMNFSTKIIEKLFEANSLEQAEKN